MTDNKRDNLSLVPLSSGFDFTAESMDMGFYGGAVAGIPSEILDTKDSKKILQYASEKLTSVNQQCYIVTVTLAALQVKMRVYQGSIFNSVKTALGEAGLIELCKTTGVSRRTAINYIDLFHNRDTEFLYDIGPSKALQVIGLLQNENVEIKGNKILFHTDNETLEIGVDEAKTVTVREFGALIEKYTSTEKQLKAADNVAKKKEEIFSSALIKRDTTINKLEAEIRELRATRSDDPETADLEELERRAHEFTVSLACFLKYGEEPFARCRDRLDSIIAGVDKITYRAAELIAISQGLYGVEVTD